MAEGLLVDNRSVDRETRFAVSFSNLVFGPGATEEVGDHVVDLGGQRVMVLADPIVAGLPPAEIALRSLRTAGLEPTLYADIDVEPTDSSFQRAAEFARSGGFDAFVAVGGGSTIDTAKAANLYATYPAEFLDYVNAPIGAARPVPGPLRPLVAIPTTAGTGSETTGVAIFDYRAIHAKTGIAHRRLRPSLGIVDPDNTRTCPPALVASAGFDVLSHALESYTAINYTTRAQPERPSQRTTYQGANPFSDTWAERTISMVAHALPRVVDDPEDYEARLEMCLAASYAGIGFGNAGVHLPHGMSYAVSGLVRDFRPTGYRVDHAIVPHGMSVVLTAPSVFRWTGAAAPERHRRAAALLGAEVDGSADSEAGALLADRIIDLMRRTAIPNGIEAVGFTAADAPALAEATLPQHRVTKLAPRQASREDIEALFRDALRYW